LAGAFDVNDAVQGGIAWQQDAADPFFMCRVDFGQLEHQLSYASTFAVRAFNDEGLRLQCHIQENRGTTQMFILSDPMFYICMLTSVTVIYLTALAGSGRDVGTNGL
jgi:hypothetical protein